jgi:hypothetical protein
MMGIAHLAEQIEYQGESEQPDLACHMASRVAKRGTHRGIELGRAIVDTNRYD